MSEISVPELKISSKKNIKILVVYHSDNGSTRLVAENVAKGVSNVEGVQVDLLDTEQATARFDEIEQYDGYLWGSPSYFGGISANLKAYLEKTTVLFFRRNLQDKIAGGFTNSASASGDKQSALLQLTVFAAQQGMIWVPLGISPTNNKVVRNEESYNRAGFFNGLATQSYIDGEKGSNPPQADLRTALHFGERFAKVALQYYK